VRVAVQRVRGALVAVDADCAAFTAPEEPVSPCGTGGATETGRSLARPDLFCEAISWQWEELSDGDRKEFAVNGCPMVSADRADPAQGDARKGNALAPGQAPTAR
jgi:hypothetical protein